MAWNSGQTSSQLNEEGSTKIEEHIKSALEYFSYDDATVLAEAYYSRAKTDNALYLLSHCFQRSGRVEAAYDLLKANGFRSAQCRFLFARCAFELRRLQDAESALRDEKESTEVLLHSSFNDSPIISPFANALLAQILCETNRLAQAQLLYKVSLAENPLSWTSIKSFYDLRGESLQTVFAKLLSEVASEKEKRKHPSSSPVPKAEPSTPAAHKTPENASESGTRRKSQVAAPKKKAASVSYLRKKSATGETTETRRSTRLYSSQEDENDARVHSQRQLQYSSRGLLHQQNQGKELRSSSRLNQVSSSTSRRGTGRASPSTPIIPTDASKSIFDCALEDKEKLEATRTRRSHVHPLSSVNSPLPQLGKTDKKLPSLSGSQNSVASIGSKKSLDEEPMDLENATPSAASSKPKEDDACVSARQDPVFCDLVEWIWKLSEIQRYLSSYKCVEALKLIAEMPPELAKLPLSMELHGRTLFEDTQYQRAIVVFEELRRQYPNHVEGMEMFSSALWHIQDAHRLSALSADLTSKAGDHPESWCAAANCFSLQKQHETAVECLERAVRLNPRFGYAYALMGHELLELNDLRRAAESFRQGILYSHNDYRVWHGLGLVDLREEKLGLARVNISKAVTLNPRNTILLCQLSVIEQSLRNSVMAMDLLNRGLSYEPNNVACRYNKAKLLFETGRYEDALKELHELRSLAPDEANVFFLLGRVNRKMGRQHDALLNFSWASEIDPRGEQTCHSAHDYEIPD